MKKNKHKKSGKSPNKSSKFNLLSNKGGKEIVDHVNVKNKFTVAAKNKAIQRRKTTLLQEFKLRNKTSLISDRRIGEHSRKGTNDDSGGSRYTAIRLKNYNEFPTNMSTDYLTHHGKTLNEIENFETVESEDEDEGLGADFVKRVHFGGRLFSEAKGKNEMPYKDLIDQLIDQSKRKKEEQKKLKEQTSVLTKELDDKLQPLLSLLKTEFKPPEPAKTDEYDMKVKQLQFDKTKPPITTPLTEPETDEDLQNNEKFPDSYISFEKLLIEKLHEKQGVVVKKLIKICANNSRQRQFLCEYLLKYMDYVVCNQNDEQLRNNFLNTYKMLVGYLLEVIPTIDSFHNIIGSIINVKHEEYKKNKSIFPRINVLIYLRLVAQLFLKHNYSIVSMCTIFIDEMLTNCKIETFKDVCFGLFLVTTALQYNNCSTHFLPSTLIFLHRVLFIAVPHKVQKNTLKNIPLTSSITNIDLVLTENVKPKNHRSPRNIDLTDLLTNTTNDELKLNILHTLVNLVKETLNVIKELPFQIELTEYIQLIIEHLPLENYPEEIVKCCTQIIEFFKEQKQNRTLTYIVQERKKPPALRLYEPKIQKVYEHKRTYGADKDEVERNKMVRKFKKERKGAIKELRRDRVFLTKVKIGDRVRSDHERLAKVKRIFSEGNTQQAELNVLERKKKKK